MLNPKEKFALLTELGEAFRNLENNEIDGFIATLFTPKELSDLANRWATVKMLHKGLPQRKIAEELGISLCKITRGSKELKRLGSPLKAYFDNHS